MQTKFNTTVHLSAQDVESILKDFVRKNSGIDVNRVSFDIKTVTTGYGTMERDEKVFTGATVSGDVPSGTLPRSTHNSLAAQINAVEKSFGTRY